MDLEKQLQETIVNNITHPDYAHVCNLSDKYKAFIINAPRKTKNKDGKTLEEYPLNDYLRQFVRREDADLFEQRKNLTKHYLPSICSQLMKPFNKVVRSNRVVKLIDTKKLEEAKKIDDTLINFYGESDNNGVDQFLNERFKILTFIDPNAWLHIAFNPFDENKEKPQTFPIEYSCESVINFSIVNDQTQWLIVKLKHDYIDKDNKHKTTDRFIIYGEDDAYEYIKVPEDIKEPLAHTSQWTSTKDTKDKYYVNKYNHKSGQVPLMRVGYIKDVETNSRTYVNPFHYEALPLMEQFIKLSSELQLSITLHAFPQQISYTEQCEAKGCANGILVGGAECSVCNGTGKKHHGSAADIKEIPMPKRLEDMVDVSKLSAYIPFPEGVLDFLDKYADKLEKKIMRMMFNSESIVQTQFNTATEATFDMDSVYDTLHPFGDKYSEVWMFFVNLTVLYMGYEKDTTVWHKFPSDLKLKTLNQLLDDLKKANESSAPSYIRESINNDILDIIYADDQSELSKLKIKNRHFPFPGKSDVEINNIILNNNTTKFKQILYSNFDSIFDDLESEHENFYSLALAKQKELIKDKVDVIIEEIGSSTPKFDLKTA
ncbi:hypothetical protein [Gaetbulibacter sp. PBL-D1]|uniref:hypothetical protein n=1 Tax=Gaetbulibacter sp. PBL-D1 TaxID=3422594 RepID=UPI003D2EDB8C